VKNFSISLDSLYPARFDYICEHEGSWNMAVRTMTWVARRLAGTGGMPTINLTNPIAWAQFLQAWRNGAYKKKR
jgi:hypothetical protein